MVSIDESLEILKIHVKYVFFLTNGGYLQKAVYCNECGYEYVNVERIDFLFGKDIKKNVVLMFTCPFCEVATDLSIIDDDSIDIIQWEIEH